MQLVNVLHALEGCLDMKEEELRALHSKVRVMCMRHCA